MHIQLRMSGKFLVYFSEKTILISADLEDTVEGKDGSAYLESKNEFHGKFVHTTKEGTYEITNAKSVEFIQEKNRHITRVTVGSIRFEVFCPTEDSLTDLWMKYTSGEFQSKLSTDLDIDQLREKYSLPNLHLHVAIDEDIYHKCMEEIRQSVGKLHLYIYLKPYF